MNGIHISQGQGDINPAPYKNGFAVACVVIRRQRNTLTL